MAYERYRPTNVIIPSAEFQARAQQLLRELVDETEPGRIVMTIVVWARRQIEAERTA